MAKDPEYEDRGMERMIVKRQSDGTYKIFNKKWGGPLFCSLEREWDRDYVTYFSEKINYDDGEGTRWKMESQSNGTYKIINVLLNRVLFCAGSHNSSGHNYLWAEGPNGTGDKRKEQWDFELMQGNLNF